MAAVLRFGPVLPRFQEAHAQTTLCSLCFLPSPHYARTLPDQLGLWKHSQQQPASKDTGINTTTHNVFMLSNPWPSVFA